MPQACDPTELPGLRPDPISTGWISTAELANQVELVRGTNEVTVNDRGSSSNTG